MSAVSRKVSMGLAAGALAAAATLTPVTVAHAGPSQAPFSAAGALGGQLGGGDECVTVTGDSCEGAAALIVSQAQANALPTPEQAIRGIFQNNLWWFGTANPTPPPSSPVLTFQPLSLVPGFLKPLYGWFTQNLNLEACVFGASLRVGPYGTTTFSVGRGCA
ncbi:hypothetical protein [Arthrobacter sp. SLBN-53]|uniref:hypothetical protein n=1 Tax=Arthrobacter sp. SLBN-53 TaxID=2768412 RepID=UPI00114E8F62|nr:hypothetical protein [Arthrobacter sp. SLBN-53]TQK30598.1 hypothetical protein FBY28_3625 [Arthrobacter sp. SLBN-53]